MILKFLRPCPIWNFQIPAESVEEIPDWIGQRLINGGAAMLKSEWDRNRELRAQQKALKKPKPEKKTKKSGEE